MDVIKPCVWLTGLCYLLLGYVIPVFEASHHVYSDLQSFQSTPPADQPYRTAYHFQPPRNWMNDPNAPMIYKGIYHFFYQYNPKGVVWGNIVWAHSTSTDLINWTPHDPAIYPSQPSDINGCWSGSATILPGGKPIILYTGMDPQDRQVQNLAVPKNLSDPFLVEWVKSPQNPLMEPTDTNQIDPSSFRDPTTAWLGRDGRWRVIVGSKRGNLGIAILYRSKDFYHWIKAKHPLHASKNTKILECPDFYPVSTRTQNGLDTSMFGSGVKHVFKASLDETKHDYYTIGRYNPDKDIYTPDNGSVDNDSGLRYDYGKFYASKTFFDSDKNRRILWGWINESTSAAIDISKGWSGLQAIPRRIWLDKSGKQLVQWPVEEIEKLHSKKVDLPNTLLKGGAVLEVAGITGTQADVEISFEMSKLEMAEVLDPRWGDPQAICSQKGASVKGGFGPFGLLTLASTDLHEYTAVFFRVFKAQSKYVVLMCSDLSRSSLDLDYDKPTYGAFLDIDPLHEKLSLRTLIDHSIVENFGGGGKTCITSRVYPTMAIGGGAHLYAFNNGSEGVNISNLTAWSMNRAQIN